MVARKPLMKPKQLEMLATVWNQDQIAKFFELSPRTVRNQIAKNDNLRAAYKKGRDTSIREVAGALKTSALGGNVTSMIFFLKTQGGGVWRETQNIDIRDERTKFQGMNDFYAAHIAPAEDVAEG